MGSMARHALQGLALGCAALVVQRPVRVQAEEETLTVSLDFAGDSTYRLVAFGANVQGLSTILSVDGEDTGAEVVAVRTILAKAAFVLFAPSDLVPNSFTFIENEGEGAAVFNADETLPLADETEFQPVILVKVFPPPDLVCFTDVQFNTQDGMLGAVSIEGGDDNDCFQFPSADEAVGLVDLEFTEAGFDIFLTSSQLIGGFQFNVQNANGNSVGDFDVVAEAEALENYSIQVTDGTVFAFSLNGDTIPVLDESTLLLSLEFEAPTIINTLCLAELFFVDGSFVPEEVAVSTTSFDNGCFSSEAIVSLPPPPPADPPAPSPSPSPPPPEPSPSPPP
eukprot:scaffold744_cov370-Prasinococcus_capsulatus_cf.AAC.1